MARTQLPRLLAPLPLLLIACGGSSSSGGGSFTPLSLTTTAGSSSPSVLAVSTFGEAFSLTATASGGVVPYTFAATGLPAGITSSSTNTTFTVSGSPQVSGNLSFEIAVTDASNRRVSLTIQARIARRWLVYKGDIDTDAIDELYAVDASTSTPSASMKINGNLVAGGDIVSEPLNNEIFSPDSLRLLYIADQITLGRPELFLVDMSGAAPGASVRINGAIQGTGVKDFRWSPTNRAAVYLADQDSSGQDELYFVDLAGSTPGTPIKISGTLNANGDVEDLPAIGRGTGFEFAPDGSALLFAADRDTDGVLQLFSVDLSGPTPGAPVLISGASPAGASGVAFFTWSFTGRYVAFAGDLDSTGQRELYLAERINGVFSSRQKISPSLGAGGEVVNDGPLAAIELRATDSGFGFRPDDQGIAFRASLDSTAQLQLFYLDLSSGSPTPAIRLNDDLPDTAADINSFQFSSDSRFLAYNADQLVSGQDELFLVNLSGPSPSAPTRLNAPMVAAGDAQSSSNGNGYNFAPDSQSLFYRADQDIDGADELYLVDLSAASPGIPVKLHSAAPTANEDVFSAFFAPDSSQILYVADLLSSGDNEARLFNRRNSQTATLNGPLVTNGDVQISFAGLAFSRDGRRMAYRADQQTDAVIELFLVDLSGASPSAAIKVNGPIVSGGTVRNFTFSR